MLKSPATRFYKLAQSVPCEGGYCISLDDRKVNTPSGQALIVKSEVLAQEIATEWDNQGEKIEPGSMPMMRLACTAIDKVGPIRENLVSQMADYGANDLLCYFADGPEDLVARQHDVWIPLLAWAKETYGVELKTTSGIVHVSQSEEAVSALLQAADNHDDFELTALAEITQLTGSLVLGLAISRCHLDWQEAYEASQLDETWQSERWGEDHEATIRNQNRKADMEATTHYLTLVRS
jgi:chaperone required for assembly of F1-ATPase